MAVAVTMAVSTAVAMVVAVPTAVIVAVACQPASCARSCNLDWRFWIHSSTSLYATDSDALKVHSHLLCSYDQINSLSLSLSLKLENVNIISICILTSRGSDIIVFSSPGLAEAAWKVTLSLGDPFTNLWLPDFQVVGQKPARHRFHKKILVQILDFHI